MLGRKNFILIFLVIAILISFGLGVGVGKFQVICEVCPPEGVDFSLFWEAWSVLEENFIDKERFNTQEMIYGAISGMVESLGDPYTVFLNPEETKRFIEDIGGAFEGVGMEIDRKEDQLQVVAPLEGTPADRAGLRAGDKITEVDGKSTIGMPVNEAVNLIRGPKGTEVILTIYREEWGKTKEIKITRGIIEVPSLKWELKEENIAYLKLYHFTEKAGSDFKRAAIEILDSPAEKIILDVRNNPGGYLETVQEIAGWFLERGQIVVIGEGKERKYYRAEGNAKLLPYPIVVLINKGSASGSEILAAALRDNRQILLIGENSFGKGLVQESKGLRHGSSLKITTTRWLTPGGDLITNKGLEPDPGLRIEMTDEDYQEDKDLQLDKAIEIIKKIR